MALRRLKASRRLEIESIFEDAIELPPKDRGRWLTGRCGADSQLHAEVDALIAAHERAEGVLEGNVVAAGVRALGDSRRGRRIGAYRVMSELGRGGMGVVYLAERDDGQYEQRVAVKLLRASPDAEHLHRRFIAERQILFLIAPRHVADRVDQIALRFVVVVDDVLPEEERGGR